MSEVLKRTNIYDIFLKFSNKVKLQRRTYGSAYLREHHSSPQIWGFESNNSWCFRTALTSLSMYKERICLQCGPCGFLQSIRKHNTRIHIRNNQGIWNPRPVVFAIDRNMKNWKPEWHPLLKRGLKVDGYVRTEPLEPDF